MKVKKGLFSELESVLCSCSDMDKGDSASSSGCCLGKPKIYDSQPKPNMIEVSATF